jgi:hypothetical protein
MTAVWLGVGWMFGSATLPWDAGLSYFGDHALYYFPNLLFLAWLLYLLGRKIDGKRQKDGVT